MRGGTRRSKPDRSRKASRASASPIRCSEAVFRSQIASALKGNAYAQKHSIERYARAERERTREISERNEIWERYAASWREQIAETERKGDTPLTPLPHPDDVLIVQT